MKKINIILGKKTTQYQVIFTDQIIKEVINRLNNKKVLLLTDQNVYILYGEKLIKNLKEKDVNVFKYVIKPGEKSKSLRHLERGYNKLLENKFNRFDYIIALGGGVVGDLSGLLASTYKRGIKLIQIPTTLLAQVDSSVGGKTAVNYHNIKNLIGTFYNPELVLINVKYLNTLSKREFLNGLTEVIKTAIIGDKVLLNKLSQSNYRDYKENYKLLSDTIMSCIKFKIEVVKNDMADRGIRRILNFGHTIGHILEQENNLSFKHGEAVALGIKFASLFSVHKNLLNTKQYDKIINILNSYQLPTKLNQSLDFAILYNNLINDKKNIDKDINMILLKGLFNPIVFNIDKNEFKKVWEDFNG